MTETATQNNKVYLCGTIESASVFSHEVYGEGFYEFLLSVPRLLGQNDVIPITFSERLQINPQVGSKIALNGQFRSYNKPVDGKSKLMHTVFAKGLSEPNEENPNTIEFSGNICNPPIYRNTPNGEICDFLVAVSRSYCKCDYIPCIALDENAGLVKTLEVDQKVVIQGRIQSGEYGETLSETKSEPRITPKVLINKITLE